MYLECPPVKQSGAGLPIAIFVITVMSLIVLGMSLLQESSSNAVSLQIQSQRAFFAAESGAQAVLGQIMPANRNDPISCPSSVPVSLSFPSGGGLNGCSASVTCASTYAPVLTIESQGTCGAGFEQASRTIRVRLQ